MDTKSKKFSHSVFVKAIIFIVMLGAVIGAAFATTTILKETNGNLEMIVDKSYLESSSFLMEYEESIGQLSDLIHYYVSEESIKKGNTVDEDMLKNEIEDMYWDQEELWDDEATFEKEKQKIIEEDLKVFRKLKEELKRKEEPLYYVKNGKQTYTNTKETRKEAFEKYPVFYINDGHEIIKHPETLDQYHYYYDYDVVEAVDSTESSETVIYAAYTEEYMDAATSEWEAKHKKVMRSFYLLLAMVTLFGLGLLYLMITAGRHFFGDEKVHMQWMDKLYVDLNLILLWIIIIGWFIFGVELNRFNVLIYPVSVFLVGIAIILFLSLVRHVKNRSIMKHSVIYTVLHFLYRLLKDIYNSGSVGMKIIVVVIAYPLVTAATLVFFPITIALAVWLAMKQVKDFQAIQEGTRLMREGNLDHKIAVQGSGEFAILARNINGINEGFKQAVENELKNERMKTELITNVSHDIRTPLTSLITYTDLLKKETDPEKIREYVVILEQKSKRLQVLTDDLFAAAKASSGDIPVDLQEIDLIALLNQGIGEVSEQIIEKGLEMKVNHPEEKVYVIADGKLLWRSIENILSNIFRYALEDSRVYIDITEEKNQILISFKNISKYELNITEEVLMERFKRGDESRASQGSGLGLSITKSLIENQGGSFEIRIDGDLFKSMIYLQKGRQEDVSDI